VFGRVTAQGLDWGTRLGRRYETRPARRGRPCTGADSKFDRSCAHAACQHPFCFIRVALLARLLAASMRCGRSALCARVSRGAQHWAVTLPRSVAHDAGMLNRGLGLRLAQATGGFPKGRRCGHACHTARTVRACVQSGAVLGYVNRGRANEGGGKGTCGCLAVRVWHARGVGLAFGTAIDGTL
jgi:hypothetical protein